MPRFNVNAPDGSIIPVDAPEGATEQDAIEFAASTWKPVAAPTQSEIPAARQAPGFMTQLGRGAASLADVTLGGVLPAVAQQIAYPISRLGRTPEQAQAATQRVVGAIDQPFGKVFNVTETPEYQQESGRQLLNFIGQNFQKGTKWLSEKTGISQPDVENLMGTATIAAPKVIPPAIRAAQEVTAPLVEKISLAAKMPFERQLQARREAASLKDYARGPQIDAAAEAQRLGIALNPVDIQPTLGPKLTAAIAGEKGVDALTSVNKNRVRSVALEDMGLPPTTQLNNPKAFQDARAQVSKPYEEVKKLPIQQADDAMIQRLESIRSDLEVIGAKEYAPAISKIVDDAIAKTQTGLTGEKLIKNISVLRERAKKTYNNKAATTEALDIADTNLRIATELESMIDNSISNPKLLQEYRDARQKMARTYAYEGATDLNTGMVDVGKIARITSSNNSLTGNIASLGKIAGNFPEVFTTKAARPLAKAAAAIGRTGAAGTLGGLAGYALGQDYASAAIGSVLGAGAGKIGESMAANRLASPSYQAGLQLRDMRIPVNQLAASMQPIPQSQAIVPYQAPVEVLMSGQGPYQPNFVMRPGGYGPITTPGVAPGPAQIGMAESPVGGQMGALRMEDIRARDLSMRQGAAAEAQQAAAAAASRKPAGQGSVLEFDPITGTYKVGGAGVKGATPEVFMADTGQALKMASEKVAAGKLFDMSAAEKVAWKKTKVDLAEVAPELKGLDDKAIAAKMMDRKWIADTISNLREKDRIFNEIAQKSARNRAASDAANKAALERELMLNRLMELQDSLRPARPVQKGGQGPKTRAFQRNELIPPNPSINELAP